MRTRAIGAAGRAAKRNSPPRSIARIGPTARMRRDARASARRDATREAILAAALRCFSRDGYRRTALDRVARDAAISRAALYLHFRNKEELFRALVAALHADSLAQATDAARGSGALEERVTNVLAAKTARFFDLLRASDHADEFLDENHRLCGDLSARAAATHARVLARMLRAAAADGLLSFDGSRLTAVDAAELLLDTAEGIKVRGRTTLSTAAYRARLARAVAIVVAGLAPHAARMPGKAARPTARASGPV